MISWEDFSWLAENLDGHSYTFAKTMTSIPHSYTLRKDWDDQDFVKAVEMIREYGYDKSFYGKTYRYFNVNGNAYWTMGDPIDKDGKPFTILINRAADDSSGDYDVLSSEYDEMFLGEQYLEENDEVCSMLGDFSSASVLDIGCGTGLLLDMKPCGSYVGIDPSQGMLDVLKYKHPNAKIVKTGFESFYPHATFDRAISLFGAVSYIEPECISRLGDMVIPGGESFLMFYAPGYFPVTYENAGVYFPHHDFSEYQDNGCLDGYDLEEWASYVIARKVW